MPELSPNKTKEAAMDSIKKNEWVLALDMLLQGSRTPLDEIEDFGFNIGDLNADEKEIIFREIFDKIADDDRTIEHFKEKLGLNDALINELKGDKEPVHKETPQETPVIETPAKEAGNKDNDEEMKKAAEAELAGLYKEKQGSKKAEEKEPKKEDKQELEPGIYESRIIKKGGRFFADLGGKRTEVYMPKMAKKDLKADETVYPVHVYETDGETYAELAWYDNGKRLDICCEGIELYYEGDDREKVSGREAESYEKMLGIINNFDETHKDIKVTRSETVYNGKRKSKKVNVEYKDEKGKKKEDSCLIGMGEKPSPYIYIKKTIRPEINQALGIKIEKQEEVPVPKEPALNSVQQIKEELKSSTQEKEKLNIFLKAFEKGLVDKAYLKEGMRVIYTNYGLWKIKELLFEKDGKVKENISKKGMDALIGPETARLRKAESIFEDKLDDMGIKKNFFGGKRAFKSKEEKESVSAEVRKTSLEEADRIFDNFDYIAQVIENLLRHAEEREERYFLQRILSDFPLKENDKEALREIIKKYWKEVAVHGFIKFNKETGETSVKTYSDLDGKSVIWLMEEAGIKPEKVHYVRPGKYEPDMPNFDTGGKTGVTHFMTDGAPTDEEIERMQKEKTFWGDHHGENSPRDTSATEQLYNVLSTLGLLDGKRSRHYRSFVRFVTLVDNQAHPAYNDWDHYKESYKTLLGLEKFLKPEELFKFIGTTLYAKRGGEVTDDDFVEPLGQKELGHRALKKAGVDKENNVKRSVEAMDKMGTEGFVVNSDYGKITVDIGRQIPDGGLAVRAKQGGKGAFVNWDPTQNSFFITCFDKDLPKDLLYEGEGEEEKRGLNIRGRMWIKSKTETAPDMSLGQVLNEMGVDLSRISGKLKEYIDKEDDLMEEFLDVEKFKKEMLERSEKENSKKARKDTLEVMAIIKAEAEKKYPKLIPKMIENIKKLKELDDKELAKWVEEYNKKRDAVLLRMAKNTKEGSPLFRKYYDRFFEQHKEVARADMDESLEKEMGEARRRKIMELIKETFGEDQK